MATDVVMPRLSDSMEEGTVSKWLVGVGAEVRRGQPIVEVDTDKATVAYEADVDGILLEILAEEGAVVPLGGVIARIGAPGEAPLGPLREGRAEPPGRTSARSNASPVARRLARELGVDLATVTGTGPKGTITRADVEAAAGGEVAPLAAESPTGRGEATVERLTRLQEIVARRMVEAHGAPDFALEVDIDMTACVELRRGLASGSDPAPTLNDLVVKACALALREFPRANGAYRDEVFELYPRVNVGIAVAAENTLIVPTIFDADVKPLAEIAREARQLAGKVRERTIDPAALEGGTFTVTNLGSYGIDRFWAIINAGQAAILAIGAVKRRPVVDAAGEIVARDTMSAVLVCDHRILYGADAAAFLARIRELLERPNALVGG